MKKNGMDENKNVLVYVGKEREGCCGKDHHCRREKVTERASQPLMFLYNKGFQIFRNEFLAASTAVVLLIKSNKDDGKLRFVAFICHQDP